MATVNCKTARPDNVSLTVSPAERRLIYRVRQISKTDRAAVMVIFVNGDEVEVAHASRREKVGDAG